MPLLGITALYTLLIYARLLLNFGIYVGPASGKAAFFASIRWSFYRDIIILTVTYALLALVLMMRRPKA
jgi:hypothetical protein